MITLQMSSHPLILGFNGGNVNKHAPVHIFLLVNIKTP